MVNIGDELRQRIVQLCEQKQMSIYRLAKKSGVPQSTLNEIMQGRSRDPRLSTIIQIAQGFDMSIQELLDDPIFESVENGTIEDAEKQAGSDV